MKQIMIWMILAVGLSVGACHQTTVGYLLTENASYDPDTMYIRKTLDPELDAVRIENKAPWVSLALQAQPAHRHPEQSQSPAERRLQALGDHREFETGR